MITLKTIFLTLLVSNFFAVFFIGYHFYISRSDEKLIAPIKLLETNPYKFDEPLTAFHILEQLDVFEPVDDKYYNNFPKVMNQYSKPHLGLKTDPTYCRRHRAYFADHPEFIFETKNFMTDHAPGSLVREKALKAIGNDIQPKIGAHMSPSLKEKFFFDIKPEINLFFFNQGLHTYKHVGKDYACTTQIYNNIPGRATINRKDYAAESVVEYAKQYEGRPECFNYDKFFPKTWVLRHEDQCRDFFEKFNSPQYLEEKANKTIVYIRKIGAGTHQAAGVQPVNETEETVIRETYKNGELCGKVNKSTIIQTYIYNPLLLNGHKFDFRIYMVIGSTYPTMLYYHDGFLRVSLHEYDVTSQDKGVLLTNTALSDKIFDIARKEGNYQGLNETELRSFQMWTFDRLQKYLLEQNMIDSDTWLDDYLRPEFKKAMIHLVRMTEGPFLRRSQVYELFGCDFMLDSNLNLWFIECNSGPVLSGATEEKGKFVSKMLTDQYEIVYGMLKSRTKRIIEFVNSIIRNKEYERNESGAIVVKDLEEKRKHFKEITKNKVDPEFEPSPDNGFAKIYDGNLDGTARYAGLISQQCL